MVEVTRRQTLALGAGAFLTDLLAAGAVRAAGKDTLTIAFNVNLPSFDPTDGTSAVNPSIQAIYRSIFDQYIGQAPDLTLKPGILTAWGWNDDKTKLWMDVRPDVKWQDGSPLTPEDVVWSLERAGDEGQRQSHFVHLVDRRQLQDRRQPDHGGRHPLRADLLHVDGLPDRLCPAQGLLREGRRGRLREEADRLRPLYGRRISGQRLPAAEGQSRIIGATSRRSRP